LFHSLARFDSQSLLDHGFFVFIAFVSGRTQKTYLFRVTTAQPADYQVKTKAQSPKKWKWMIE
jgi:hypothetical protein